jgi:hypothetical protein
VPLTLAAAARRRAATSMLLMVITTGLVAACAQVGVVGGSGSIQPAAAPAASHPARPAGGPPAQVAPLTGLPATSPGAAGRPAVALVLAGPRPHGLSQADVVFEEITSPIRYIAVFQSHQARSVGPITSTRPTDGMALSVLHALVGYAGGTAGFVEVLDHTKVTDLGFAGHSSLYRQASWGLTTSTAALARAARGQQPPQLLSYRGEGLVASHALATTGVLRRSSVRVRIPGLRSLDWQFNPAADRWLQVSGGPSASVANLIVQTVKYKQVFLSHREGLTVPSARVMGTGPAIVFTGLAGTAATGRLGLAAAATWSKPTLGDVTNYLGEGYSVLNFAPGPTWIILAPPGTRISTGSGAS